MGLQNLFFICCCTKNEKEGYLKRSTHIKYFTTCLMVSKPLYAFENYDFE